MAPVLTSRAVTALKSRLYPNGLANSSGQLGKHFIPHFTGGIEFFLTKLRGTAVTAGSEGFLDPKCRYRAVFGSGNGQPIEGPPPKTLYLPLNFIAQKACTWSHPVYGLFVFSLNQ